MDALLALQRASTLPSSSNPPTSSQNGTPPLAQNGSEANLTTQNDLRTQAEGQTAPSLPPLAPSQTPPPHVGSISGAPTAVASTGSPTLPANQNFSQPLTLEVVKEHINSLLQMNKGHIPTSAELNLRPPYPIHIASLPYPVGYTVPKFVCFDGRKGNAREHVSRFLDALGAHREDRNLPIREFSKSLIDRAFSWYANLAVGSISSWEDLVKKFYIKFFYVEERLTTLHLMRETQRLGEDILVYVRRFREKAVDIQVPTIIINILSQRPTERDLDHHISIMSAPLENPNENLGLGWDIENFADLNMGEESASHNAQSNIFYNIPLNILFFNTEGVARPNFLQHYMHLHSSGRFHLIIITNTKKKGKARPSS
ncbi:uncharacterized protein LOC114302435 [Camellia sinensis]|uniref:uncharacterized protein LOC114302435 n=1 Tax=Camellia sinensis TaxID=4442 RepID=UPI0010361C1E|nr:uncharacterized protein LOC114302435 [Camellia sinensis]